MVGPLVTRLANAPALHVAIALAAVHAVAAGFAFAPVPNTGGDNMAYMTLARSIIDHGAYLELWDPAGGAHTKYPPGFPLVLALAQSFGITSWVALKTLMVGFSVLAVAVSYLWMREATRPAIALGAGLALAVAPGIASESHWILSDVPFFAATMGALVALERGRLGAGIALAFVALTLRTAAVPLLAAIVLWLLLGRRWRLALGVGAAVALLAVVWSARASGVEAPYASAFWMVNPYVPEAGTIGVADLVQRVGRNADRYALLIFIRALTGSGGALHDAVAITILAFAGLGFVRRLRGAADGIDRVAHRPAWNALSAWRVGPAELFFVLYGGVILIWPANWATERFLLPLVPLLLVYAAEGAGVVPGGERARGAVRVGGLVALLALGVAPLWASWEAGARCRAAVRAEGLGACLEPPARAYFALAQGARRFLPEGAVVLSRKPRIWHYLSGVPGQVYPFSDDPDSLFELADAIGARYLVADRLGGAARMYLTPVLSERPDRLCAIVQASYGDSDATLLAILPEGAPVDPSVRAGEARIPLCPDGPDAYLESLRGPR